jgi:hypothetical protein
MLRELAPDLWVTERSQRFFTSEIGTRMTVVRLSDGGLFVHSPVSLDPALRKALDALGPTRFAVAPNRFHHLYLGAYPEAYPDLRLFACPGLPEKRSDLSFDAVLGDEAPSEWAGQIDQLLFGGLPLANEIVFLHRASRTLIMTDTVFNIGPEAPFRTRLGFRLLGRYDDFGSTRIEKLLIRDR